MPDGQLAYGNQHVTNFLGVSLDELTTRTITERYHPDDRSDVDRRWKHSAETGEPYDHEARLAGADGVHRWVHTRGFPLRDPDGRIVLWYLLQEDVDDRRRADVALRARERNLQLIMDTTPALIWSALPDGLTDSVNRHFEDYVGFSFEQLKENGWAVAIHPDDQGALTTLWNLIRTTGSAGQAEARLRRHDGEYRWFLLRASPLRDENGSIVKWYGVNIDIEDLKQAETELSRRAAFLHQGEAVSETGSFLWRVGANEIKWSDQLYRIFGVDPGTTVTFELMASRVHPEDRLLVADLADQAQSGRDFEYEHRVLLPDGSVKYLHAISHATRDQHGRLEYVGAAQDVTARRLSEQALSKVRSELAHVTRVTSLGALAASIAHEVNQPLSGMVTNASTCLRMLTADPPNLDGARVTTQRLLRDGNRAAEVIQHLRSLFANREPTNGPVDLNDAASEVLALSSSELRAGGLVVRTAFDNVPAVRGDRVQLQQVILNLILNAADAMKSIDDRPRDLLVTTTREDGDRVRLSVCDSGVGINPLTVEKLFDAFYTTKSNGMGVGLSISRSIIESHEGRLWATTNDGPGATFSFSLPAEV